MQNYQFMIMLLVIIMMFYYLNNQINDLNSKYGDVVSKYNHIMNDNLLHNNNIDKVINLINASIRTDKEETNLMQSINQTERNKMMLNVQNDDVCFKNGVCDKACPLECIECDFMENKEVNNEKNMETNIENVENVDTNVDTNV